MRGVLRWRRVVERIHMVGLVTFLSGLLASLTSPPSSFSLSARDDKDEE